MESHGQNRIVNSQNNNQNQTNDAARLKREEAKTQQEIKETKAKIKENNIKVSKSLAELGRLDTEITQTKENIQRLDRQVAKLSGEINSLEGKIGKNEDELKKLRDEYLKAVKKMRLSKKKGSTLAFIFSAGSLSQALRRMRYLKEFSAWRGRQTDEINTKIDDLKRQKDALSNAQEEQKRTIALLENDQKKLSDQHSRQEKVVSELKLNGDALATHLQQKQAEARELGNRVSELIAREQQQKEAAKKKAEEDRKKAEQKKIEEERKAEEQRRLAERKKAEEEAQRNRQSEPQKTEELVAQKEHNKPQKKEETVTTVKTEEPIKKPQVKSSSADYASARNRAPRKSSNSTSGTTISSVKLEETKETPNTAASANFVDMKGKLTRPTTGSFIVISRFGRQELTDLPGVEFDNPGIDAQSDSGASARAVFKGKVSGVYLLPGYDTVVIVNHGDFYTVYGNIGAPSVKVGENVDTGTILGELAVSEDDPGHSTIHFEVWKGRDKLNPMDWLR